MSLERIARWTLTELPRINRAVLFDGAPRRLLVDELGATLLPELPEPATLAPRQARRLLVHLGFAGASVARHCQAADTACRDEPQRAFEGLPVGADGIPFQRYFSEVADSTETGHCHRDSYASLVRWNVGTTEVRWDGDSLAVLPGVFDDGHVRTYAGYVGEERFFELIKKGEAIELAINALLSPLSEGDLNFDSDEGLRRVRVATGLLDALRMLFHEFAALPPGEGMTPEYFMDVFRQFAVHWRPGDIPPSGALDPEALKRDFLLGIGIDGYEKQVRRIFPALLTGERDQLETLMRRPPLPVLLLRSIGLDAASFAGLPATELTELLARHPALGAWYRLLVAHARASGAHLMISKKFLFKPQTHRDAAGIGDAELVSNRRGTTGMDESLLGRLTRARRDHVLTVLRTVPAGEPASEPAGVPDISDIVRIAAP